MRRLLASFALLVAVVLPRSAAAFPHVVQAGETLAQIAERLYGRIQLERVLVAANALDAEGGIPIVPGMRLEIPALGHARVSAGDTWATLARQLLGDAERADVLAQANESMPWIAPAEGAEIVVPYNLRYVVGQTDTLLVIAQKFFGDKERAWVVDRYNQRKGAPLRRGEVLLVPITDLPLTEAGRVEAAAGDASVLAQAGGGTRDAQRKVEAELPRLLAEVRGGRYVDAVARGVRLLALGELTRPQQATLHRQLAEAYVALDAGGLAAASCAAWREADPRARLDATTLSPKILAACAKGASER
jgi:LysM repeat protein